MKGVSETRRPVRRLGGRVTGRVPRFVRRRVSGRRQGYLRVVGSVETNVPEIVSVAAMAASVAQTGVDVNVGADPAASLVGSAVGSFLTTLLVGGLLVAVFPEYTERRMAAVLDDPVGSLLYGLGSLLLLFLLTVVLVITIVGIVLAIPLALVAYLMWAVGTAVAYLAIAERLVGREDGWLKPLLAGAAINGALVLTGVGGLVAFCIGAAGFGAVLRNRLD